MQAPLIAGQFPAGYCWPMTPQQYANDLFSISYANVADNVTGIFYGTTQPTTGIRLWFNSQRGRLYEFNDGYWRSLYPWPANPRIKWWVELTDDEIYNLHNDGGARDHIDGASERSGPFWEIDPDYAGRSPMGAGAIPGTTPPRTIAVGGIDGEGDHLQLETEVAQHTHLVEFADATPGALYSHVNTDDAPPNDGNLHQPISEGAGSNQTTMIARKSATAAVPGNIIHPVRGGRMIRRTARVYYTL